jgi:hypothetical protein
LQSKTNAGENEKCELDQFFHTASKKAENQTNRNLLALLTFFCLGTMRDE